MSSKKVMQVACVLKPFNSFAFTSAAQSMLSSLTQEELSNLL